MAADSRLNPFAARLASLPPGLDGQLEVELDDGFKAGALAMLAYLTDSGWVGHEHCEDCRCAARAHFGIED